MSFLDNFQDRAYALFRIVIGFMFIWHGTQKHFNYPVDFPYALNAMTTAAGAIEIVAGVLVMIGLFTRPAAFLASGTMAVAYWMVHGMNHMFPIGNGGELSAIFCFSFLLIATKGAGMWGLDKS